MKQERADAKELSVTSLRLPRNLMIELRIKAIREGQSVNSKLAAMIKADLAEEATAQK